MGHHATQHNQIEHALVYFVGCTLSVVVATGNANIFVLIFSDYCCDPRSILDAFAFPGATVSTPKKGMSDHT